MANFSNKPRDKSHKVIGPKGIKFLGSKKDCDEYVKIRKDHIVLPTTDSELNAWS